jgi:hypothetical protein
MKIHIFRWANADEIEIGDVVLWENDVPVEVESITRTKDGYEFVGHNRYKPGNRAITMRPKGEQLRVIPSKAQATDLLHEIGAHVGGGWTVDEIHDLKPLILRGKAADAPTVTSSTGAKVTVGDPINAPQSTPSV